MTQEEHKIEVEKLIKIEAELTNIISETENDELYNIYLNWQAQRDVCNKGFVSVLDEVFKA